MFNLCVSMLLFFKIIIRESLSISESTGAFSFGRGWFLLHVCVCVRARVLACVNVYTCRCAYTYIYTYINMIASSFVFSIRPPKNPLKNPSLWPTGVTKATCPPLRRRVADRAPAAEESGETPSRAGPPCASGPSRRPTGTPAPPSLALVLAG